MFLKNSCRMFLKKRTQPQVSKEHGRMFLKNMAEHGRMFLKFLSKEHGRMFHGRMFLKHVSKEHAACF